MVNRVYSADIVKYARPNHCLPWVSHTEPWESNSMRILPMVNMLLQMWSCRLPWHASTVDGTYNTASYCQHVCHDPRVIQTANHDDVIKWKYFPRYWPLVWEIHRSPVNSPQWRGALMFSLICARINGRVNTREAGDLRRHRAHYDVIVMPRSIAIWLISPWTIWLSLCTRCFQMHFIELKCINFD